MKACGYNPDDAVDIVGVSDGADEDGGVARLGYDAADLRAYPDGSLAGGIDGAVVAAAVVVYCSWVEMFAACCLYLQYDNLLLLCSMLLLVFLYFLLVTAALVIFVCM